MAHSDPDLIAMMAMGEPDIPAEDEAHIRSCPECSGELESLLHVASLARAGSPVDDRLDPPRPEVWAGISRTLSLSPDVAPAPFEAAKPEPASEPEPEPEAAPPAGSPRRRGHVARRRNRRWIAVVTAAAVLLAIGGVGGAILLQNARLAQPTVLTEARLKALPAWAGSSGEAVVEKTRSGQRDVVVTVSESRSGSGFREVWLISPDLKKLISIGVLSGTEGRFVIPPDVNLKDYPIVDVSQEKLDGNPAHSGDSIVRGTLS
ncbi:anti-sigma factor [Lacisediminihabitans sp.]|uniref:anti-sigma factor n=1 Tax=Lacisediminihabitans sp. TaxID=2787631 RepID=UPI00374DE950